MEAWRRMSRGEGFDLDPLTKVAFSWNPEAEAPTYPWPNNSIARAISASPSTFRTSCVVGS